MLKKRDQLFYPTIYWESLLLENVHSMMMCVTYDCNYQFTTTRGYLTSKGRDAKERIVFKFHNIFCAIISL